MPALFTEALLAPTAQYSGAYAAEFSGMNEPSYVSMKGKSPSTQATVAQECDWIPEAACAGWDPGPASHCGSRPGQAARRWAGVPLQTGPNGTPTFAESWTLWPHLLPADSAPAAPCWFLNRATLGAPRGPMDWLPHSLQAPCHCLSAPPRAPDAEKPRPASSDATPCSSFSFYSQVSISDIIRHVCSRSLSTLPT